MAFSVTNFSINEVADTMTIQYDLSPGTLRTARLYLFDHNTYGNYDLAKDITSFTDPLTSLQNISLLATDIEETIFKGTYYLVIVSDEDFDINNMETNDKKQFITSNYTAYYECLLENYNNNVSTCTDCENKMESIIPKIEALKYSILIEDFESAVKIEEMISNLCDCVLFTNISIAQYSFKTSANILIYG